MTFTEADYFAIRNDLLKEEQTAVLAVERKYMSTLLTLIEGIADDICQDFYNAVELRPFWVNYAPKQRGRAPTGTAIPWGDMGEKTIIARLGRAIERSNLQATHPGVPVGGDARLATTDALIHFDVKLTGPNDRADEIVASPYQISGDGRHWDNGVRNSKEVVQGRRARMEFQPQLPPF